MMLSGVAVGDGVGVGVVGGAAMVTGPPSWGKVVGSATTPAQPVMPAALTGAQGWLRVPAGGPCGLPLATAMVMIGLNPTGRLPTEPTKVKLPVMVNSTQLSSGRGQGPLSIGPSEKNPVDGGTECMKACSGASVAVAVTVAVGARVPVGVGVGVDVAGASVDVGVLVGDGGGTIAVGVLVLVGVLIDGAVGVAVGVRVDVGVRVVVGVLVGVVVVVDVLVGVGVRVGVDVLVAVDVAVGVDVGVGCTACVVALAVVGGALSAEKVAMLVIGPGAFGVTMMITVALAP
jgi:hypothetical protein